MPLRNVGMPSNLLMSPRCRANQLGLPMPDDPHAVSACLPLWQHNVGYEEGDPLVHSRLQAAYPRFCLHPVVQRLCDTFLNSDGRRGLPFVSQRAAERAAAYVMHRNGTTAEIIPFDEQQACAVVVPDDDFKALKQYWQHAGENVSSRVAEQMLAGQPVSFSETPTRATLRARVADFQGTAAKDVYLFPSGMAAIGCAWRAVQSYRPGPTCQFGFPYVDTLKIQQRFPNAEHLFLPTGNAADLQRLEAQCRVQPPSAVFCEVPTNPLLVTPDLQRLRELADTHDFLLIVDDTLGACGNVAAVPLADVVVTSLTKYFSGYGNVLAGSLVLNSTGRHWPRLQKLLDADFEENLSDADAEVLCRNSDDLQERMGVINSNAVSLASFLAGHPAVDSVYFPAVGDRNYEFLRTAAGGYGGLLSIVLRRPAETTPEVFDNLQICKGPNLGTNFTLCCPYTILAHYDELDVVESQGVSRWLLRISVGMEPIEELKQRFARALPEA